MASDSWGCVETKGLSNATALLGTLYHEAGRIDVQRARRGEAEDYRRDIDCAIAYLQKAVELRETLAQDVELASSLSVNELMGGDR
jgi:hypothetical protein